MSTGRATLQSQLPLSDEMPSWNREEFKHSRDIYVTVCFFWLFFTGIPLFYFFVVNAPNSNGRTIWTLVTLVMHGYVTMMYVFPTILTRHMNLFLIWHKDGLLADRGLNNLADRVRFIILQLLFAGSIAQIIDYLVGILRSWVPDPRVMTPFIVNLIYPLLTAATISILLWRSITRLWELSVIKEYKQNLRAEIKEYKQKLRAEQNLTE